MKKKYDSYGNALFAGVTFLIMMYILFWADITGLSDNGDFRRVMVASSLDFLNPDKSFIFVDEYAVVPPAGRFSLLKLAFSLSGIRQYPSIQLLFVRFSVIVDQCIRFVSGKPRDVYSIGTLGFIYSVCYSSALYFLFRTIRLKNRLCDLLLKLAAIFVLCDAGYIAYFNSFYGEAVQIIAFACLLAAVLNIVQKPRLSTRDIALFCISVIFFGWSKFFNIPVAIFCIMCLGYIVVKLNGFTQSKRYIVAFIMSGVFLFVVYAAVPKWMNKQTAYNSVFFGMLRENSHEDNARYLEELGLSTEFMSLANTNYYISRISETVDSDTMQNALEGVSNFKLVVFYIMHPGKLLEEVSVAIQNSGFIRPYYLSNYGIQYPRLTFTDKFRAWSVIREKSPFDTWSGNILLMLLWIVMFIPYIQGGRKQGRMYIPCIIAGFGLFILAYNLILPVVLNGEADIAKHMFSYVQIVDVVLLCIFHFILSAFGNKKTAFFLFSTATGLAVFFILPPLYHMASDMFFHRESEYVSFGSLNGEPLLWHVSSTDTETDTDVLIGIKPITMMPFSEAEDDSRGVNNWGESSLREWLNSGFLSSFSDEEMLMLESTENSYNLSGAFETLASGGSNDYFATHIPRLADRGNENAIYAITQDYVSLPTVEMIAELNRSGRLISQDVSYWLNTPYYNNSSMVRCVFPDGYVYFQDSSVEDMGVVPVIRLKRHKENLDD